MYVVNEPFTCPTKSLWYPPCVQGLWISVGAIVRMSVWIGHEGPRIIVFLLDRFFWTPAIRYPIGELPRDIIGTNKLTSSWIIDRIDRTIPRVHPSDTIVGYHTLVRGRDRVIFKFTVFCSGRKAGWWGGLAIRSFLSMIMKGANSRQRRTIVHETMRTVKRKWLTAASARGGALLVDIEMHSFGNTLSKIGHVWSRIRTLSGIAHIEYFCKSWRIPGTGATMGSDILLLIPNNKGWVDDAIGKICMCWRSFPPDAGESEFFGTGGEIFGCWRFRG